MLVSQRAAYQVLTRNQPQSSLQGPGDVHAARADPGRGAAPPRIRPLPESKSTGRVSPSPRFPPVAPKPGSASSGGEGNLGALTSVFWHLRGPGRRWTSGAGEDAPLTPVGPLGRARPQDSGRSSASSSSAWVPTAPRIWLGDPTFRRRRAQGEIVRVPERARPGALRAASSRDPRRSGSPGAAASSPARPQPALARPALTCPARRAQH